MYRIIQEALNNTRKYAQATKVQLYTYTTATQVHVTIQDNGRGFDLEQVSGGYGLQGMQERVAVLQGHLHLESQPGDGCCITVEIPMHISHISHIPQMPKIYIPKESPSISKNTDAGVSATASLSVKIGEWQPLNLNEWQNLASLKVVVRFISSNGL
ncbi:MAG: ATP-binding protein [Rhizonema sp. PD38]|nr:ATP-binding protein [Rhizonema sp. PD38]